MLTQFLTALNPEQLKKLADWQKSLPKSRAVDGAQFEYVFIPTSIGTVMKVRCGITSTEIDLTDYSEW